MRAHSQNCHGRFLTSLRPRTHYLSRKEGSQETVEAGGRMLQRKRWLMNYGVFSCANFSQSLLFFSQRSVLRPRGHLGSPVCRHASSHIALQTMFQAMSLSRNRDPCDILLPHHSQRRHSDNLCQCAGGRSNCCVLPNGTLSETIKAHLRRTKTCRRGSQRTSRRNSQEHSVGQGLHLSLWQYPTQWLIAGLQPFAIVAMSQRNSEKCLTNCSFCVSLPVVPYSAVVWPERRAAIATTRKCMLFSSSRNCRMVLEDRRRLNDQLRAARFPATHRLTRVVKLRRIRHGCSSLVQQCIL